MNEQAERDTTEPKVEIGLRRLNQRQPGERAFVKKTFVDSYLHPRTPKSTERIDHDWRDYADWLIDNKQVLVMVDVANPDACIGFIIKDHDRPVFHWIGVKYEHRCMGYATEALKMLCGDASPIFTSVSRSLHYLLDKWAGGQPAEHCIDEFRGIGEFLRAESQERSNA